MVIDDLYRVRVLVKTSAGKLTGFDVEYELVFRQFHFLHGKKAFAKLRLDSVKARLSNLPVAVGGAIRNFILATLNFVGLIKTLSN